MRIEELLPADSPRLNGVDDAHVHRLAEIYASLPPVLVHRATMRVVDGMHRIAAASLKGLEFVEVRYFDGAEEDAFLRAVTANVSHGLPLSVADRKAAALRVFGTHPDLSDRAVAACVGLDAKTVATARRRSVGDSPRSNNRVGSDGRSYPLDRTAERMHAARLMATHPDLPLRAIVKETGLSLGTAHDVRQRLLRGESPVPVGRRQPRGTASPEPAAGEAGSPGTATTAERAVRAQREQAAAPGGDLPVLAGRARLSVETLHKLARDPSLRHTESGRHLLRWLHTHFVVDDSWRQHADSVPPHCSATVAELALQCSGSWKRFADELSRRLTGRSSAP
ncbi:ParB/RepB/Spo0J family partition protein [Streptomyces verrucosisporus]|uniref:ParB/RepB/Spo0J family partition protein n=1 Tax=Streptomyces verrucosisporus TaxID=1695161 RepID=UPI0027DA99B5|nr:ParB/RepB/Spo0J family partition protein [Streptomyces verrucosisporus]